MRPFSQFVESKKAEERAAQKEPAFDDLDDIIDDSVFDEDLGDLE